MVVSRVAMPNVAMAAAIGMALLLPAVPTNGAAMAPITNCKTPSNPDALPAVWVLASASVVEFGMIRPRLAVIIKSDGRIPARPVPVRTTTSNNVPPSAIVAPPQIKSVCGETCPTSRELNCAMRTIPRALMPKRRPKRCGETS